MENIYCCLTGKLFVSGQVARLYMRTPDETFLPVHPSISADLVQMRGSDSGVEFYSTSTPNLRCDTPQYRVNRASLLSRYCGRSRINLREIFPEGFSYVKMPSISFPPGFGGEDDYDPHSGDPELSLRLGYIEEQFQLLARADQDSLLLRLQRMIGAGIDVENSQPADAERLNEIRAQQEGGRV